MPAAGNVGKTAWQPSRMKTMEGRWISLERMKSISSIEAEVAKLEAELDKAQKRVEVISAKLLKAQKQRQEYEARQILEAYRKSGRSFQELITFLDV